ncbi:MAG: hypothetical protein R3D70_24415 [Rhizobiaceae bacterium]
MSGRSALDRLIAARPHHVHKLTAKDSTGRKAYYFVYVPPARERAFMAAFGGAGLLNLEEFGRVIAANYGDAPSPETRTLLRERYGISI